MSPRLRFLLALVAGVVAAALTVGAVEALGHAVYPVPPGLDVTDSEALRAYVASRPLGALLFVVLAWIAGTVVGGVVAVRVARGRAVALTAAVGAAVLAATVANLVALPHPTGVAVAGLVGVPLAAFLTGRALSRPR